MTNSRTVRNVAGFYEVNSQFAVSRETAEAVIDTATRVVSQYTGPINLTGIQGARIPLADNPLNIDIIRLGSEQHTLLLTRRGATRAAGDVSTLTKGASVVGRCVMQRGQMGQIACSKILVRALDTQQWQSADRSIEWAVHEMGHSWGITEHCKLGSCVMTAHNMDVGSRELMLSGRPFCDEHAADLEIAGHMALAANLSAK